MKTYWKVNEVAAVIQVSEQTIYRYVVNGEIPFHKLNRAVQFKPSKIESWMESRKAGVTANHNGNIGEDTMLGMSRSAVFPDRMIRQKLSISK